MENPVQFGNIVAFLESLQQTTQSIDTLSRHLSGNQKDALKCIMDTACLYMADKDYVNPMQCYAQAVQTAQAVCKGSECNAADPTDSMATIKSALEEVLSYFCIAAETTTKPNAF